MDMTLIAGLGVWFALQVIAVWWLGSTAQVLKGTPSRDAKTAPQHNFAS
jgi:hypothetical protein